MNSDLEYKFVKPAKALSGFVESFWLLHNRSGNDKEVVVLPDGRVDLFFSESASEPFHITLLGIGTQPEQALIKANTLTFAISFKLPGAEFLLGNTVSGLVNEAKNLPEGFWNFTVADMKEFDQFCKKASQKIESLLPVTIDPRKQKLFDLVYESKGELSVKELSEKAAWSSRQINRYFKAQFGISLKSYCSILRFRSSFEHIKEGKLFPRQNFSDQSHFIKEIKKLAGVLPKELKRNQNDRFIQFSIIDKK